MNFLKQKHKTLFILIIINVISCSAVSILKNDNKNPDLISNLLKIVKNDAEKFNLKKNGPKKVNGLNKKNDLKKIRFDKKVLVKRIIPHGYGASSYEYDSKFHSFYKPLVRVHGAKPIATYKGSKNIDKNTGNLHKVVKNDRSDEKLLKLFRLRPKKVTFRSILDDVNTYVNNVESASEVRRLKYSILEVLENSKKKEVLRHKFVSDEKEPPRFYDYNYNHEGNPIVTKPPKKWLPYYSYWNYWTYAKTIHQDDCKGKLVQIGKICVETPPH